MPSDAFAAIDLGSNSFHMIVARVVDGNLQVIDRLKEMVQLGAGLDKRNRLSESSQRRGLACLARFGQRLRSMAPGKVRIVGTNTLRQARNGQEFLVQAEEVLGHPVEIISGIEEARLIYLGVAHYNAPTEGRRLVIDIGGGSTELIIGEGFESLQLESLHMGCVSMTRAHFERNKLKEGDFRAAEMAVRLEMEPVEAAYRDMGWSTATGASGSIKSIREVILKEGWCHQGVTLEALRRLRALLLELRTVEAIARRWELSPERATVFTGGFAVLHGVCETLNLETIGVSDGALREGVIYDLVGRGRQEDVRQSSINALVRRYEVDPIQAEQVAATALLLLEQASEPWGLEDGEHRYHLDWAARLHELGLAVSHSNYQKHGAYIVRYSDLAGFAQVEQQLMAALIRCHRRKFAESAFEELPRYLVNPARRLTVLLRLAVVLHRSRSRLPQPLPPFSLQVEGPRIELNFPPGWLDDHPLSRVDLAAEADYLKAAGFRLTCL